MEHNAFKFIMLFEAAIELTKHHELLVTAEAGQTHVMDEWGGQQNRK